MSKEGLGDPQDMYLIKTDPAFGATPEDRIRTLQRGGLNVYTTLYSPIQAAGSPPFSKYMIRLCSR